jgi:hypothetical protein
VPSVLVQHILAKRGFEPKRKVVGDGVDQYNCWIEETEEVFQE